MLFQQGPDKTAGRVAFRSSTFQFAVQRPGEVDKHFVHFPRNHLLREFHVLYISIYQYSNMSRYN